MTKVSIICAAHNEAAFIGDMIESVQRQSHENWELVIVSDRSEDDTVAIAMRYERDDPRIKVASTQGVSGKNSAWNRAYLLTTGQIVVYMGGDDTMPENALALRVAAFGNYDLTGRVAVFSKSRSMSGDPKFDGAVVPRGDFGSRSGPTTALSRGMADVVFPLPETLPNEDLWTSTLIELRSEAAIDLPVVTSNYRIHDGNSVRRDIDFSGAKEMIRRRHVVYEQLLASPRFVWSETERTYLEARRELEDLRHEGKWLAICAHRSTPTTMRLRTLIYTVKPLYRVRQRFFRQFSGWSRGF